MHSSKIVAIITVTAMIMLIIIPIQSIPTRHKRWTFNTWRLHGRRYAPDTPLDPITESYSPIISNDVIYQDQPVNVDRGIDGESYTMLLRLLKVFETLDHEQNEKDNDNN